MDEDGRHHEVGHGVQDVMMTKIHKNIRKISDSGAILGPKMGQGGGRDASKYSGDGGPLGLILSILSDIQ